MNPLEHINESWNPLFDELRKQGILAKIGSIEPDSFYPPAESVFNVFRMPLNDIKVIILGQDPYSHEGQAIGYAFAVSHTTKKPYSLRIIEKEVGHPIDRTLQDWRDQGVFLLNTALTVKKWEPGSHIKLWLPFTLSVISYIAKQKSCIWMLWGKNAQEFYKYISKFGNYPQKVLQAPHPAAEAYGGSAKFSGCGHFKEANEILADNNQQTINW